MNKTSKKRLKPAPVKKLSPTSAPAPELTSEPPLDVNSEAIPAPTLAPTPAPTPAAAIAALESALAAVRDLSAQRLREKLSVSRLMGVARELKELLKVMSVYGV